MSSQSPVALASTLLNRLLAGTRLRHMQLLVRVAELGSIQRAASDIGMSQPAATKAVTEIEQLVGMRLFERHARGVRPTPAGADLLPSLRGLLRSATDCAESLAASAFGGAGLVRVGAITGGVTGVLSVALPTFTHRHPQLRIEVTEESREAVQAGLAQGLFDVALLRAPSSTAVGWAFTPLLEDRIQVCAPPDHPLSGRRIIRPEHLLDYEWLLPPLGSQMRQSFEGLFEPCGSVPERTSVTTRSLPMLLLYMRERQALTISPRSIAQPFTDAGLLHCLPVRISDALPPIGLLAPDQPTHRGVALLCDYLRKG